MFYLLVGDWSVFYFLVGDWSVFYLLVGDWSVFYLLVLTVFFRELNLCSPLRFVHSAFHGVGHRYVQQAFSVFGFPPPISVPEQRDPDPNFSSLRCPNPEEGHSVLVRDPGAGLSARSDPGFPVEPLRKHTTCSVVGKLVWTIPWWWS